jgi:hypothetical protein
VTVVACARGPSILLGVGIQRTHCEQSCRQRRYQDDGQRACERS